MSGCPCFTAGSGCKCGAEGEANLWRHHFKKNECSHKAGQGGVFKLSHVSQSVYFKWKRSYLFIYLFFTVFKETCPGVNGPVWWAMCKKTKYMPPSVCVCVFACGRMWMSPLMPMCECPSLGQAGREHAKIPRKLSATAISYYSSGLQGGGGGRQGGEWEALSPPPPSASWPFLLLLGCRRGDHTCSEWQQWEIKLADI